MESEEPVEHITDLLKSASDQIKRGLVFVHKAGVVTEIRMERQQPVWIQNLKRGIVHLFSVNFLGKDKIAGDNLLFTKTEVCCTLEHHTCKSSPVLSISYFNSG